MDSVPEFWTVVLAGANVGLLIIAYIGLRLARVRVTIADEQVELARYAQLNRQFETGVALLGHRHLPVRLGGVHTLEELARFHPDDWHVRVASIFVEFVRHPPRYPDSHEKAGEVDFDSRDLIEVIRAIEQRTEEQIDAEAATGFSLGDRLVGTLFVLREGKS